MRLTDLFISKDETIREAVKQLDETAKKILLVTRAGKLQGIITDGDIRRWILKNGNLLEKVSQIMNSSPIYIYEEDKEFARGVLKEKMVEAIPVVNNDEEVVDIIFWNDKFKEELNHYDKLETPVVIMAGGEGTRLDPYTRVLPKPLIPIGEVPIVERVIDRFFEYGCNRFYMTVNYKKNMIKAYFNEIDKEYELNYVEEEKPLGTAGSLSILKDKLKETFFVSNCDILIEGNYSEMLQYHREQQNKITLISSLKHFTIPYGVIEISATSDVKNMVEKPEYDYLVNTGMYILEPEVLGDIPGDTFYHITELINHYLEKGEKIGVYPVSEKSWLDMGQIKEMKTMLERLGVR